LLASRCGRLARTQPVIEQSKGILKGHLGIDPDTAFDVLRRWSSHTDLKVREIQSASCHHRDCQPPGDPGRASREFIDLISRLNKGHIPTTV
jgi:hypothetical protein